jgi:uncharacterized membrane protein YfcA
MDYLWLCLAAITAGAVNSIAGGGTLLTFPTLIGVLESYPLKSVADNAASFANGTSTEALFPGSFASIWGYRRQMQACKHWLIWLTPPSVVGGALGAMLVAEDSFRLIIPYLILLAAVLFLLQPTIARLFKRLPVPGETTKPSNRTLAGLVVLQFFIGIYGGYFGAGIGILMLSSLSFLGLKDIHEVNALKSFLAFWINFIAAMMFLARGLVVWEYALAMAVTAIIGGYVGARLSLRMHPIFVRWIVTVIAFSLAAYYFVR